MKITSATWEFRNLGLDVQEIDLNHGDCEKLKEQFDLLNAPYQVAKVEAGDNDILGFLQDNEFRFIEDQIKMCHLLNDVQRSRTHQRMHDAVGYRIMDEADFNELLREVDDGMFDTDRFAIDDRFGKKISSKRYHNWICDMKEQGIVPYAFTYKDKACAFVVLKPEKHGIYHSVIGGYYRSFRESGMGIVQKEIDIVKELGGRRIISAVSSNNIFQIRAMCINGYVPFGVEHVLVKYVCG